MDLLDDRIAIKMLEDGAQSHMQGDMDDTEAVVVEHHGKAPRPGALGQDFCVTGVRQACRMQPLFVQRRRHDSVCSAGQCLVNCDAEKIVSRTAGRTADVARSDRVEVLFGRGEARNFVLGRLRLSGMPDGLGSGSRSDQPECMFEPVEITNDGGTAKGMQFRPGPRDDLGSDAGDISHRDEQTRVTHARI
jgi:hypothetical protein